MDTSASSWFSELGLEDPLLSDQFDVMDFFDEELFAIGEDLQCSLSAECNFPRSSSTTTLCASENMEPPQVNVERPAKQHKPNNAHDSSATIHNFNPTNDRAAPSPMILSFGNSNAQENNPQQMTIGTLNPEDDAVSEVLMSRGSYVNLEEAARKTTKKTPRSRPPAQTYDHIIAERKRREQLSRQFVALSAIVPGLKKMDKTSVLGDAIKYLKHLQERVKMLEEQAAKQTVESLVLVKKSQILIEDEGTSDEQNNHDEQPFPEIEAKVCDKHVLVRIQCENYKGVLVKILSMMHNLNLVVTNTNFTPFGSLALDITIIAEMEKEFNLTMTELLKGLRSALKRVRQKN